MIVSRHRGAARDGIDLLWPFDPEAHDTEAWRSARPVRGRRPHWRRRNGRGVPSPRHPPRPHGGRQGPPGRARLRTPTLQARFEREARAISALEHPHICTLHDVGEENGRAYLVMEHLAGETLAARLKKGPLPLALALELGTQVAEALAAAHTHGIVHRDLKPGNVMLTKTGVKLLDFGLAHLAPGGPQPAPVDLTSTPTEAAPLTGQGTILGTVPYMAPEQLEGKPADARTDLWALGTLLHEMVTGRRAVRGDEPGGPDRGHPGARAPAAATLQPLAPARAREARPALPGEVAGEPLGHGSRPGRRAALDRPGGRRFRAVRGRERRPPSAAVVGRGRRRALHRERPSRRPRRPAGGGRPPCPGRTSSAPSWTCDRRKS